MNRRLSKPLFSLFVCLLTLCALTAGALALSPSDPATADNVLAVLNQYDKDAYHIMKTEYDQGANMMHWFAGENLISGMDTAVHETYHQYTFDQADTFYGEKIYLGGGVGYNVDYEVVYKGPAPFVKTEEMSRNIPASLRTFRYDTYVAAGVKPDANTKGVFGLLNEFSAYCWGLEVMNSLTPFLLDSGASAEAWSEYVSSVGNNMTAYAEFKYWTLRYMRYLQTASPALYQAILDNESYCAAYRDTEAKFVSEIAESKEIIRNSSSTLSAIGCSIDMDDSGIYLVHGFSYAGTGLKDYTALMAELSAPEYTQMDAILKQAGPKAAAPTASAQTGFSDVSADAYYAAAVNWAIQKGITNGTSASTFSPNDLCTRAQILTFIWRYAGSPEPAIFNPFLDVTANAYYYKAALWAYEKGMVTGPVFQGETPCTRAAAVTYLWILAERPRRAYQNQFTDVAGSADYAQAAAYAVDAGITNGTSATTFSPEGRCTRAHIVTFLNRYDAAASDR